MINLLAKMTYSRGFLNSMNRAFYLNPKTGVKYTILTIANLDADEDRRNDYPITVVYTDLGHKSVWSVTLDKWIEKDFILLSELKK